MRTLLALALLAGLACAWLCERRSIASLRAENQALQAQGEEAQRLEDEAKDQDSRRAARSSNSELLRLRNELRQLRAQQQEAEKLRAANQRVAAEIQGGQFKPRRLAEMPDAVPREKWVFAGFATPQAAVQSFLTALASGDPEQVLRCLPPHEEKHQRQRMTEDPERFRQEFLGGMGQFAKLSAFRITHVRVEDEKAMVEVQLTADGSPIPFELYREDNQEWKLNP